MRYGKSVYQLEKGLPPNTVVPLLKERVDTMKERVNIEFSVKKWVNIEFSMKGMGRYRILNEEMGKY